MEAVKPDNMKRIYLWANNRSLGTVFLKWLSNVKDAQIINGIFTSSFFYGADLRFQSNVRESFTSKASETVVDDFPYVYDASVGTYSWAKTQLECDYPGKKFLICKDLPFALCGDHDLIPSGFRHTFIIRHPYKMFSSWKKTFGRYYQSPNLQDTIENCYYQQYNYKEQYEIIQYLKKNPDICDSDLVILDVDDLLNQPASILSQYCRAVGIPYTDDMLQWEPGTDVVKNWKISKQLLGGGLHDGEWGFYKTAIRSSHFLPPKKLPDKTELDEDVLACADISMPFYKMMYDMRTIRP